MQKSHIMGLIFSLFAFLPTLTFAETSFQQTLFSCTFAGGENSVQVLYSPQDDGLTYAYANAQGRVELNLNDPVETVDYSPFAWDRDDITQRVTFYNGGTSYEVFSMMTRSGIHLIGGSVGGIVVTTPSRQRTELLCDQCSVEPANVFQGIGRLALLKDESYDAFDQCLSRARGQSGFPSVLISDSSFQNGGLNERSAFCGDGFFLEAA